MECGTQLEPMRCYVVVVSVHLVTHSIGIMVEQYLKHFCRATIRFRPIASSSMKCLRCQPITSGSLETMDGYSRDVSPSERFSYKQNLPASVSSFIGREQELREV